MKIILILSSLLLTLLALSALMEKRRKRYYRQHGNEGSKPVSARRFYEQKGYFPTPEELRDFENHS